MARLDALSIELRTTGKDKLAESYGKVIPNIMSTILSTRLKNTDLSGDITSGTMEVKRFVNSKSQAYGTARQGGKGNYVKAEPVVIAIDDNTEYMEEVEEKDLRTYGVSGLIERRTKNQGDQLSVELDTKFFAEAAKGTVFTTEETDVVKKLEKAIVTLETTKNDFVQGVPRNMIEIVCSPSYYSSVRMQTNAISNSLKLIEGANYEAGRFNNVNIYSSAFLPADVEFIVMVNGSVAQPVTTSIYNPSKIELSDATAFGLFAYKGTKMVTPDLVLVSKSA